jgi:sensor domain CHASE-containing protein
MTTLIILIAVLTLGLVLVGGLAYALHAHFHQEEKALLERAALVADCARGQREAGK